MKKEDLENWINDVKEKIGEDNASKIADNLGNLITDNSMVNEQIEKKDTEIKNLKKDKETLIKANGNLLLQIRYGRRRKGRRKQGRTQNV